MRVGCLRCGWDPVPRRKVYGQSETGRLRTLGTTPSLNPNPQDRRWSTVKTWWSSQTARTFEYFLTRETNLDGWSVVFIFEKG